MAIIVQEIIDKMRQVGLDAEGADYYRDDIDLIPAINAGIDWLVAVVNSALGASKLSEESLREITLTKIYQTSRYSRVYLDPADLGHSVWTILSIMPKPLVYQTDVADKQPVTPVYVEPAGGEANSALRPEFSFIESDFYAKRLTLEEWNVNKKNPFKAGNVITDVECEDLLEYAYLDPIIYSTGSTVPVDTGIELTIRPELSKDFVAISYVKYPNRVAANTDAIELPLSMSNLLYQKALQFVSYKQGDDTTVYNVTANDINILLNSML
jgi:hypothetical protein